MTHHPFLILKPHPGTYPIPLITLKSPHQLPPFNPKNPNKIPKLKQPFQLTQLILQQPIYTYQTINPPLSQPPHKLPYPTPIHF
ncbi:glutamate--cysteine ligase, partial [Neisseria sicca]|uniref:glutamate--cysteine ligase n=1 Tax=Neisseria sicca TaxID=490 RepID=UPI0034D974EB